MKAATCPRRLPWVIPEYCEGCTSCVAACPKGLIEMRRHGEDGYIPWIEDPDSCTGCGRCADMCGMGAIGMTEYVEEARDRFATRPGEPARHDPDVK